MNIYNYLYKLTPKSADKVIEQSNGKALPDGYVTDGLGNIFKFPSQGKTTLFTVDNINPVYKFCYDFTDSKIEMYYKEGGKKAELVYSIGVSPVNFIDNPDYWFTMAYQEAKSEVGFIDNELATKEAINAFGAYSLGDEKENYRYKIVIYWDYLGYTVGDWEAAYNKLYDIITDYNQEIELMGQNLKVHAEKGDGYVIDLIVDYPMELEKEELLEVFYDYQESMKEKTNNQVEFDVEDIVEVDTEEED